MHAAKEKKAKGTAQRSLTNYLQRTQERFSMSQDGVGSPASSLSQISQDVNVSIHDSEYTTPSQKRIYKSLESIYSKIATKFQTKLHKSTNTLAQEIAALGTRTDRLEIKHDELIIAHNDPSREY